MVKKKVHYIMDMVVDKENAKDNTIIVRVLATNIKLNESYESCSQNV